LSILLILILGLIAEFSTGNDHGQFVYTGFTGSNLTLDGAARITSTGLIELTNDTARIKGHAVYPSPLRFRLSPDAMVQSFSLSFVFGILSSFGDIRGHGFAFFIAPSNVFTEAFPIQFLGLFNSTNNGSTSNQIFAIELDTIQNTEFGDIDNNHVGIDINGLNSLKSHTAGFYNNGRNGTFTNLPLIGSGPIQTWVEYDGKTTQINVTLAPLGMEKPVRPLLSLTSNLSTILKEQSYIGFSSSTGLSTGHHCVLGWSFGINSPAPIIDSTKLPKLPYLGPRSPSKLLEIILPIASAVFVLAIGTIAVILVRRHLRYKEVHEDWEVEYGPHRFTYKDLFHATKGFSSKHLIGVGGFGRVYKGVLPTSKSEVAVKRVSYNSKQGVKQFVAEVVSMGHLQHNNIVKLFGYCRRKGELLLVYDYMVNGSLDKYLYGEEDRTTLDWGHRFKIIKGIASGLLYLHEEWDKVVIHRDVKPNNVLLDKEMNGRLGDFGLARLYDHGTDPQTTHVVGTIGYLAPELVHRGKATTLTDVFAFGIFILEVTCGRKPMTEDTQNHQVMLVDWVIQNWNKDSLLNTMDIKLQGNYDIDEAFLALKLGLLCSHPFPDARPNMRQVLQYLDGDVPLPELLPAHFSFPMLASMQNGGRHNNQHPLPMKVLIPASYFEFTVAGVPGMVLLSFHLQLLFFLALSLASTTATGEDQFVYSGFSGSNLNLDGAATITTDGVLELTNHTVHIKGHAFYPTPWRFRKSPGEVVQSFSVTFVFGMIPIYSDECTDGMTFLISPTKDFSGAQTSQYLGLLNKTSDGKQTNHIFAVELDSSQNTEFNDIDDNHIGININSLTSNQTKSAAFYDDKIGMFKNLSLVSRKEMQVWVDYNGETTQINVTLAPLRVGKPSRPLLSAIYNLSTVLEDPSYIGFSASTGPINSLYCVTGWSLGINRPAPLIDITKLPKLPHVGPKPRSKLLEIILPIATALFILLVGTTVVLLVWRRMKYAEVNEDWEAEFGPHRFSYKDLFHATDGFKNKNLLGQGGFGKVYKGLLSVSKLEVAVKRVSHESKQGIKEFVAEIVSIGHLRHRNLVQLLGYCRRKGELLLVYEYMSNGSLDKYLHCEEDKPTLNWAQRFKIIKDVASGLFYLHERWEKVVIHRDIKASNVLLDSEMNGHLGDFGLARLYDHGTDPQTTHVVGTMGYLAPELARTGKATTQTDVYAFGIFILEVTCGQRPINSHADDSSQILIDWVVEHWHKGSLTYTIDSSLQGNYNSDEVSLALNLGLLCAHPFCNARPSMRQVIQYLNGEMPLPELMPTNIRYSVLGLMQNEGFDQYASLPSTVGSSGMTSSLSSGR
ncbi:L-type lectin-domain containing receptor kinase IV.2, partial [Dichanthelium oligosanthes]